MLFENESMPCHLSALWLGLKKLKSAQSDILNLTLTLTLTLQHEIDEFIKNIVNDTVSCCIQADFFLLASMLDR